MLSWKFHYSHQKNFTTKRSWGASHVVATVKSVILLTRSSVHWKKVNYLKILRSGRKDISLKEISYNLALSKINVKEITILSITLICIDVFCQVLHISCFLKLHKGAFTYYILTKWPKFEPFLSPCSYLFDFSIPLLRMCKILHHSLPNYHHHYPAVTKTIAKSCYFIDS